MNCFCLRDRFCFFFYVFVFMDVGWMSDDDYDGGLWVEIEREFVRESEKEEGKWKKKK